jgi:hypothetical protein
MINTTIEAPTAKFVNKRKKNCANIDTNPKEIEGGVG